MKSKNLKNLIYSLGSIILIATLFTSCRKNSIDSQKVLTKDNGLSTLSRSLGVNTISETGSDINSNTYHLSAKTKTINGIQINLSVTTLEIEEKESAYAITLNLMGTSKHCYLLDKQRKSITKIQNAKSIPFEKILLDRKEETILAIAMIIFNDIMSNKDKMVVRNELPENENSIFRFASDPEVEAPSCERTIVSVRLGESRAVSHVNSATTNFIKAHPDCVRVYGVDTGCLWGSYVCVASQSIKCTGGGCNVAYGELPGAPIMDIDTTGLPVDTPEVPSVGYQFKTNTKNQLLWIF